MLIYFLKLTTIVTENFLLTTGRNLIENVLTTTIPTTSTCQCRVGTEYIVVIVRFIEFDLCKIEILDVQWVRIARARVASFADRLLAFEVAGHHTLARISPARIASRPPRASAHHGE